MSEITPPNAPIALIIDPFSTGALYAPKLHQLGFACYAVLSSADLPKFYLNSFCPADFVGQTYYSCAQIREKFTIGEIAAVVVGAETGVIAGEQLAADFALPGNAPTSSLLRRDKFLMQDALAKHHLRHIYSQIFTQNDAQHLANNPAVFSAALFESPNGYIIKPVDSAGSEGVIFCADKETLVAALAGLDFGKTNGTGQCNERYLLQTFVAGDEFVVDMVAQQGQFFVCSLCRYQKGVHNGSRVVYESMTMLDINAADHAHLIAYAKQAAKALDVRFGAVHIELLAQKTAGGVYIDPVMIELGARLHGGVAPKIFAQCYTPDLLSCAVAVYSGQDLATSFAQEKTAVLTLHASVIFMINDRDEATLDAARFETLLQAYPSYSTSKITSTSPLPLTIDLLSCPALVCLVHENAQQIAQDAANIRQDFSRCLR